MLFTFMAAAIGLLKWIRNIRSDLRKVKNNRIQSLIFSILSEEKLPILIFKPDRVVKEILVSLCRQMRGVEYDLICQIYSQCGLKDLDLKTTRSWSYKRRLDAIQRLALFRVDLDDSVIRRLMRDPHISIRWMTIRHVVEIRGLASRPYFIDFLLDNKNLAHSGVKLELILKYCRRDSQGINEILLETDDSEVRRLILKVFEFSPQLVNSKIVYKILESSKDEEIIISSIKVLKSFPDFTYIPLFRELSKHSNPVVRFAVTKALEYIGNDDAVMIIASLTEDSSYLVRKAVVHSLIQYKSSIANQSLYEILNNQNHPSYQVLKNELAVSEFYGN